MIKSMTGFGRSELKSKFGSFTVEIRTVNHRYFDLSFRAPNSFNVIEDKIKKYIHKFLKRGKINCSLFYRKATNGSDVVKIDDQNIEHYYKMLCKVKKRFKLQDQITLSNILSFPDVIVREQSDYNVNDIWPLLETALKKAILECCKMREREGKNLYKDINSRISNVSKSVDKISRQAPLLLNSYKKNLDRKLKDILKNRSYKLDRARLETELAFVAKQCDISEELTRAKSHLKALKSEVHSNKEAGRRIDFLLQELQREINTLGSKAGNIQISGHVVDIKSEIEKIREQAQNVE